MDDQKKKAIAAAAKEVLKRPYSEITYSEVGPVNSLESWTLQDRISGAVESFTMGGGIFFVIWLRWNRSFAHPDTWPSIWWVIAATMFMTVLAFIHPGWGESFLKLFRIKTTERNK